MRSNDIHGSNGNCSQQDPTRVLHLFDDTCNVNDGTVVSISTTAIIRKYDLADRKPVEYEHDYCDVLNFSSISEFKSAAISYIAGFVVKMTLRQTTCRTAVKHFIRQTM